MVLSTVIATDKARSALNKLQDPPCQILLAGQHPALCAGPLLSTVKLLSAIGLAADLEKRGIPAVALFWIADEDHDVGELNPGSFRNGSQLGVPFDRRRRPPPSSQPVAAVRQAE